MEIRLKQFLIIVLAHFLFNPVYFNFTSKVIQQLLIFSLILVYVFLNFNNIRPLYLSLVKQKKSVIILLILVSILTSTSFLIPLIYGTNDFSFVSQLVSYLVYAFFYILLIGIVRKVFQKTDTKIKILEIFTLVQRNYVLVTILFILSPKIKMMWINSIHINSRARELIQQASYVSRVSWNGYAGFTSTVFSTIAVIVSIYLIIEYYKKNQFINKSYLLSLIINLVGNAFYGRSGLLVSLLMVGVGMLYMIIKYNQYGLLVFMFTTSFILFIGITILSNYNETIGTWYNWAMEPIISFIETGEFSTSSTEILWDMWFIPDFKTFLIGDGYYTSPLTSGYYMATDVGFLRPMLFFGSFYTLVYYLIPIISAYEISKRNIESKLLAFMLILSLFIFEIKGEVVLLFTPIILIIFVANNLTIYDDIKKYQNNDDKIGEVINE